jgi:hypothetical protein
MSCFAGAAGVCAARATSAQAEHAHVDCRHGARCEFRPTSTTEYLECPLPSWSAQSTLSALYPPGVPKRPCTPAAVVPGAVNGAACATSSTMRHTPAGRGTCTTLRPKVDRGVGAPQYPRRRPCMSLWRSQASHDPSSFCSTVWYLASTLARAEQTWKRRSGVLPARFVAALCLRSTHSADLLTTARVRSGCVCRRSNGTAWR